MGSSSQRFSPPLPSRATSDRTSGVSDSPAVSSVRSGSSVGFSRTLSRVSRSGEFPYTRAATAKLLMKTRSYFSQNAV